MVQSSMLCKFVLDLL